MDESQKGGYLPVNSDDDNYNQVDDNARDNQGDFGNLENDLLPLSIQFTDTSPHFSLQFEGSKLRMWTHRTGGNRISSGQDFDPNNLAGFEVNNGAITIWAEGLDTTGNGSTTVRLQAMTAMGPSDVAYGKIKLRIFTMNGAANVPGYTSYDYEAKYGVKAGDSKWLSADTGTMSADTQGNTTTDRVTVDWNEGPERGFVQYQAAPGFVWIYDVNVVKVTVSKLTLTKGSANVDVGQLPNNPNSFVISGNPAITATADVHIEGPLIDGVHRGQRFVGAGFMQVTTSRVTNVTATHNVVNSPLPKNIQVVHQSQGNNTLLDVITHMNGNPADLDIPWYDGTQADGNRPAGQFFQGSGNAESTDDDAPLDFHWEMSDTPLFSIPSGDFTVYYKQIQNVPPNNNFNNISVAYRWTAFNLIWKFETLIGVGSGDPHKLEKDIQNNIFFARARGKWTFNGSGTNNNGNWAAAGAGVTVGAFQEEHDRTRITWDTTLDVKFFNDLLFNQGTFTANGSQQLVIDTSENHNRIFRVQ